MGTSDGDRLSECRALGSLAGMTSAGVAFGAYFMGEIFKVTSQIKLFELNVVGGLLVLGIFAFGLGAGGFIGRWVGERVIYPIRTGNNGTATKTMSWLMIGGVAVTVVVVLVAFLWRSLVA